MRLQAESVITPVDVAVGQKARCLARVLSHKALEAADILSGYLAEEDVGTAGGRGTSEDPCPDAGARTSVRRTSRAALLVWGLSRRSAHRSS